MCTKHARAPLHVQGCPLVVATRGSAGAILFDGETWFHQAPHPVTPSDTLGAGDAFISGFLVSYIAARRDRSVELTTAIETALDKGAAFAAKICMVQGAFGHGMRY